MTIVPPRYVLLERKVRPRPDRIWTIFAVSTRLRGARLGPLLLTAFGFVATFVPLLLVALLVSSGLGGGASLSTFYQAYTNPALLLFTMLMSAVVGSGIISDDLKTRSISLYLSRPITVGDYLVAKSGVVALMLAILAILPGVLTALLTAILGFVSWTVAGEAAVVFVGVGALVVLTFTGISVLLSSLTERRGLAAAGIFATVFLIEIIAAILTAATSTPAFDYLSPWEDLLAVARAGFGVPSFTPPALDPYIALSVLAGLIPASFGITYLRLLRLEVLTD